MPQSKSVRVEKYGREIWHNTDLRYLLFNYMFTKYFCVFECLDTDKTDTEALQSNQNVIKFKGKAQGTLL